MDKRCKTFATFMIIFAIGTFLYWCMCGAMDNTILLGDDVRTTDRYTDLFNDMFSGKVVMTMPDGLCTVRDENGTERTFERHWLDKVDSRGEI